MHQKFSFELHLHIKDVADDVQCMFYFRRRDASTMTKASMKSSIGLPCFDNERNSCPLAYGKYLPGAQTGRHVEDAQLVGKECSKITKVV